MPVITIYRDRIQRLLKQSVSFNRIVELLPYLGLDLEETSEDYVRVEYNPNRPDFSTDYGVARALNGLLSFERGCPEYRLEKSGVKVKVEDSVKDVRPYIVSLQAKGIVLDDETIRQIITMQEDLHTGIGRRRRKVSIGIHNSDVIKPPYIYSAAPPQFSFIPLGGSEPITMKQILKETDVGREYGAIVSSFDRYPLLTDSLQNVLSFPPIINGELTRVTANTRNLFIDVTGTDLKAVSNALTIIAAALRDADAELEAVELNYGESSMITPDMTPLRAEVDLKLTNRLLGLKLSREEVAECLAKSRISIAEDSGTLTALIPRYRVDIMHAVDLVEEVAIGYGLERFTPTLPRSSSLGDFSRSSIQLNLAREALAGLGFTEVMNFSLVNEEVLYDSVRRRRPSLILEVESPKTSEHKVLRDQLIPSLLANLARNLHQEYPQRIFEVAKVFTLDERKPSRIREDYHAAAAISHIDASFSEVKSCLIAMMKQAFNIEVEAKATSNPIFTYGRAARVHYRDRRIGLIGEIHPQILENFGLRTPVAAFELNPEDLLPKA